MIFAAGKTSLVRRRVLGVFSDSYFTTIGVRIDKLSLDIDGEPRPTGAPWDVGADER